MFTLRQSFLNLKLDPVLEKCRRLRFGFKFEVLLFVAVVEAFPFYMSTSFTTPFKVLTSNIYFTQFRITHSALDNVFER